VNEVFTAVQGEGPYTGRRCSFVRLGYCVLSCPNCDTQQTWNARRFNLAETCPDTEVDSILASVPDSVSMVVVSGGEPLLWQRSPAFRLLLDSLLARGVAVHVETSATIAPTTELTKKVAHFTVSPKLTAMGGGDPEHRRIRPAVLAAFADLAGRGRACFKIVVEDTAQVAEAAAFADRFGLDRAWVWVMPEATDTDTLVRRQPAVTQAGIEHGLNVTSRLHVIGSCR